MKTHLTEEFQLILKVITNHTTTILEKKVNYSAEIGTQPIWDVKR